MLLFKILCTYYGRIIHVLRGKVLQLYKLPFNLMLEIWAFYLGYFEKRKVYELTLSNYKLSNDIQYLLIRDILHLSVAYSCQLVSLLIFL